MESPGTQFQRVFVRQPATCQDTMDIPLEDQPVYRDSRLT